MPNAILTLNAGSSSIKFALFACVPGEPARRSLHGVLEGIGSAPRFRAQDGDGRQLEDSAWPSGTHENLLGALLAFIDQHLGGDALRAVGHRVVHGGPVLAAPSLVTPQVLQTLESLVPLAPLHQPHSIAPIRAVAAHRPNLPQAVCFDTAFHRTMSDLARRLPLPPKLGGEGLRRYGFHGLSYEFIASRLKEIAPHLAQGRVVVAHLGNGASLCALHAGRSVDTTMSFSALDGLVMGTRCGALDPGVVLHLIAHEGMKPGEVERLLYERAGLLGVSGISSDMRTLLASPAPEAQAAVDLFVYRAVQQIAAMAAGMGGIDGLVFTAGIGEHAAPVRAMICARLDWIGIRLDEPANARGAGVVSANGSAVEVRVIPTDEEAIIARHVRRLVGC